MNKFIKKIKFSDAFLVVLFVGFGLYMYLGNKERNQLLDHGEVKYSIGVINDLEYVSKGPPKFIFTFLSSKNISQESSYSLEGHLANKPGSYLRKRYFGKKFLVKYSIKKPKYNEFYLNKSVPDSLYNCVDCIWDELPTWAK